MNAWEKLFEIIGCDGIVTNHSMTVEEVLEIINCEVCEDEDSEIAEVGEIIDMDTGKATGIDYDDLCDSLDDLFNS